MLDTVRRIHTDTDRWREWSLKVQRFKQDGSLALGSVFRWKSGGVSIVLTLRDIEPMRKIAWTGEAMGARVQHE